MRSQALPDRHISQCCRAVWLLNLQPSQAKDPLRRLGSRAAGQELVIRGLLIGCQVHVALVGLIGGRSLLVLSACQSPSMVDIGKNDVQISLAKFRYGMR